jgi:hypothetical protein
MAAAALLLPHPPKLRRRLLPALGFLIVPALFWILHPWKLERSWGSIVLAAWLLAAVAWPEINAVDGGRAADSKKDLYRARLPGGASSYIVACARAVEGNLDGSIRRWARRRATRSLTWAITAAPFTGSSVSASMGPVWKWMLIEASGEAARDPALARGWSRVDFSRFDKLRGGFY